MSTCALDNPVWHALNSDHAALARVAAGARRYPSDTAPFVAVAVADVDCGAAAQSLIDDGESVLFVGPAPPLPAHWQVGAAVPIAQLTCETRLPVAAGPPVVELSAGELDDMLGLTALVYPHYFRPRTIAMGRYIGIYDGPRLAAMAGERMRFTGHTEISAVCTHPDYTGRGYAQRLVALLTNDILAAGRLAFLHVSHENARAKALYERMGYRMRGDIGLRAVTRVAGSS